MITINWREVVKATDYSDIGEDELVRIFTNPQDTDDVTAAAEIFSAALKEALKNENIHADVFHFVECDLEENRCDIHFVVVDVETRRCLTYSKFPIPKGSWCLDLMQIRTFDDVHAALEAALTYILAN